MNHRIPEVGETKRTPYFDLNKVDYNWIEKTSNLKDLKAAYREL